MNLLVVMAGPDAVPVRRSESLIWIDLMWYPSAVDRGADSTIYIESHERKFAAAAKYVDLRQFSAVCLADDDIDPVWSWGSMFDLFHETVANVAQPALTADSYISHPITRVEGGCRWRETNFVEVMCPIFSRDAIDRYADDFGSWGVGWGLETYWAVEEEKRGRRLAILDSEPVKHLRPVGKGSGSGRTGYAYWEANAMLQARGLGRLSHQVFARHH